MKIRDREKGPCMQEESKHGMVGKPGKGPECSLSLREVSGSYVW